MYMRHANNQSWIIHLQRNKGSKIHIDDAKQIRMIAMHCRGLQIAKLRYAPTTDLL